MARFIDLSLQQKNNHQLAGNVDLIFVYGTLRRNSAAGAHHPFLHNAIYLGGANLQAKLFRVSYYPGAVLTREDFHVSGEVYELVGDQQLQLLDDYEECPQPWHAEQEYRREIVSVTMQENNKTLDAWTYLYNHPVHNLEQIMNGDFNQ